MIYLIFLTLVAIEVVWDWYYIERLNRRPDYNRSNMIRIMIGMALWAIAPALKPMTPLEYLIFPALLISAYWFFFDWWLNLARTWGGNRKAYWYLGNTSTLDLWQKKHGGAFAWFWIKGMLVIILIIIIEVII